MFKKKICLIAATALLTAMGQGQFALAQVMTSNSYTILSSSINCGGGVSTSNNYAIQDSLCETVGPGASDTNAVFATSASYSLGAGFQAMTDIPFLTVSFSDPDSNNGANTVAFGTLSTGSVSQDQIGVTVTTNAESGYSATLIADGAFRTSGSSKFGNVSDGTVSAGGNEYGVRTSGTDGQYNATDTCVPYSGADGDSPACTTTAKTFATNTSWVSSQLTTLTFKASPSSTTPAGSYSHTITIIVTGTF